MYKLQLSHFRIHAEGIWEASGRRGFAMASSGASGSKNWLATCVFSTFELVTSLFLEFGNHDITIDRIFTAPSRSRSPGSWPGQPPWSLYASRQETYCGSTVWVMVWPWKPSNCYIRSLWNLATAGTAGQAKASFTFPPSNESQVIVSCHAPSCFLCSVIAPEEIYNMLDSLFTKKHVIYIYMYIHIYIYI